MVSFVSEIGGLLSIYLGISIFSVCEILEVGMDFLVLMFFKCCNKEPSNNRFSKHEQGDLHDVKVDDMGKKVHRSKQSSKKKTGLTKPAKPSPKVEPTYSNAHSGGDQPATNAQVSTQPTHGMPRHGMPHGNNQPPMKTAYNAVGRNFHRTHHQTDGYNPRAQNQ